MTRRLIELRRWIVVGLLLLIWIAVSGLIILGRGDVESLLYSAFGRYSWPDAYRFLSRIVGLFWGSLSVLISVAFLAAWNKRSDIFLFLMLGPAFAFLLCLATEKPSDPNWYDILAMSTICLFVGTLVTSLYWIAHRWR